MYGVTTPRTITASRQYAGAGLAFCWAGLSIKPPSDSLEHETIRLSCSAAPGTCLSSPCVTRLWQPVLTKWTSPISGLDLEQTVLIKYQDLMVIVFSWPSSAQARSRSPVLSPPGQMGSYNKIRVQPATICHLLSEIPTVQLWCQLEMSGLFCSAW